MYTHRPMPYNLFILNNGADLFSTKARTNFFFAIEKKLSLPIRPVPDMDKTASTAHLPKDLAYLRRLEMLLAVPCQHYFLSTGRCHGHGRSGSWPRPTSSITKGQKGTVTGSILLAVMGYSRHAQGESRLTYFGDPKVAPRPRGYKHTHKKNVSIYPNHS